MPYRTTPLVNGEYYHLYNRGVAKQPIFSYKRDYERFLLCLSYYHFNNLPFKLSRLLQIPVIERDLILQGLQESNDKTVEIIAFCLMPNHFHLLVRQIKDQGISKFLKQVTNSYTRYFNTKHKRVGPIFQGSFKAVHIDSNEQLLHLSRYLHLNPLVSFVVRDEAFMSYPWSSLEIYLDTSRISFTKPEIILQNFKTPNLYLKFVMDQADYAKKLKHIQHLTLE